MRWILQKLLGLDPSILNPDARLDVNWGAPWGALWMILLVLLGITIFAAVIYKREGRPVGLLLRSLMAALRVLVLGLLVLLLCEPILAVEQTELVKPYLVFMIDTSQSMNLRDRFPEKADGGRKSDVDRARDSLPEDYKSPEGVARKDLSREDLGKLSRMDFVNAALSGKSTDPRQTPLNQKYHVQFYEFARDIRPQHARDEGVKPAKPGEDVDPGQSQAVGEGSQETRLGDCLAKVLNDKRGQNVAGVVVITDGRSNAGDNPVEVARLAARREIPIFPVGVGDRKIFDIEVRRVEAPERAFAGDFINVTATLVQKGYAGQKARVVLRAGGGGKDPEQEVTFPEDGKSFQVEFKYKPETPGKVEYVVAVQARPDELVADNNSAGCLVNVIEGKIKVLYVEGQDLPRWEYRFLKHAMMRDRTLQVTTLLAQSDMTFFFDGNYPAEGGLEAKNFPDTAKDLCGKYDVIILGDVNPEIFTEKQLDLICQFVAEGGGFMMIAGERYAPLEYLDKNKKNPVAALIPVLVDPRDDEVISMRGRIRVETFKPKVTAAGWASPILRIENEDLANRLLWDKKDEEGGLPGFFWYFPALKAKQEATVLLRHPADKAAGQNEERPLLATMRYGKGGLTMFVGTDEFWRWRFSRGDRYFYRFYAQAIQYLASARGGRSKTSVLSTDRAIYSLGEAVPLVAEVKRPAAEGGGYEPYDGESVMVHFGLEGAGEQPVVKLNKVPGAKGRYEGRLTPKGRGKYHAWLASLDPAEKVGGECDFEVKIPQVEYEDPRMDEETLRAMVERGGKGGQFLYLDELRSLGGLVPEPAHANSAAKEFALWDNWRLFVLFAIIIIGEWVLRKRARML